MVSESNVLIGVEPAREIVVFVSSRVPLLVMSIYLLTVSPGAMLEIGVVKPPVIPTTTELVSISESVPVETD
jgi:hypothetical protein